MAKQDEHRFNLRFDEDDENHRRVSAYLNQCGRKKARYIVKAVLAYWELQDGRIPVVEQPERKQLSETESAIHKIGEQNKADRLIQVEDVKISWDDRLWYIANPTDLVRSSGSREKWRIDTYMGLCRRIVSRPDDSRYVFLLYKIT